MAAAQFDPFVYKEALIVLGAAALVVPVFHRLRMSPLAGFIAVGMLVGPYGLGAIGDAQAWLRWVTIEDTESIGPVAEFGVVLLLFMIGLELSFERLKMMRRIVFGAGPLQTALCAAAIAAGCVAFGAPLTAAAVIGLALAMSSTAIIVQTLADARRIQAPVGRAAFGVLLFQDLAVAPILFAVAVLGADDGGGGLGEFAAAMAQAGVAIIAIIFAGRALLRPMFRRVARTGSPELFMAACLLVIVASGVAAAAAGLSMALGALTAGVLLAETEYRRQIEVMIEPFKGLLLGVFLIVVGMGVDLGAIARDPMPVLAGCFGLLALKGAITTAVLRVFGAPLRTAAQTGALLAPGGEFAFVVLGSAATLGVVPRAAADYALTLAAVTMAAIPLIWQALSRMERRAPAATPEAPAFLTATGADGADGPHVLILGLGRVGELVAEVLETHDVPYLALDRDADVVARARAAGRPVYFADVSREDVLRHAHLERVRALVVTMDQPKLVADTVAAARRLRPDLVIVARARDAREAAHLYRLGATDVAPEAVEASLQLAETVLVDVGVPVGHAIATIHDRRAAIRQSIQALAPQARIRRRFSRLDPAGADPNRIEPPEG